MKKFEQSAHLWVEETMKSMSIEEAVGQLLMPDDRGYTPEQWIAFRKEAPVGCICVRPEFHKGYPDVLAALNETARIPVIAACGVENGPNGAKGGQYPSNMAMGAIDDESLTEEKGFLVARQARARGIAWLFQPVIDINVNPMNPETNIRAYGDDWRLVRKHAAAQIRGLERSGVAATAKHFPGAGMDDRDQHLCTTLNPLPMDLWRQTYGKIWRGAIEAGMSAVMPGHIALPDYEGLSDCPEQAMPATLSPALLNRLLREELGFEGVIVSDAGTMIGMTSRCRSEDCAVEFIRAGGDVYLFAHPVDEFRRLLEALRTGYLPEERVWVSARRVLTLKAAVGLHRPTPAYELTEEEERRAVTIADEIAERSATIIKGSDRFPLDLCEGDKVLTVTIRWEQAGEARCPELPMVDEELRKLGCEVDHLQNPSHGKLADAPAKYRYVFVNVVLVPQTPMGNIRMIGNMIMPFWRAFYTGADNCVFTSFGSPYLLHEQPHWPNLLAMYSPSEASQRAAVGVWTGRVQPRGKLPVNLHHSALRNEALINTLSD